MEGYGFYGNVIFIIELPHEEALEVYRNARHKTFPIQICVKEKVPCAPNSIYIHTEESWFGLRFHDFSKDEKTISFRIHSMKPMFMDEEGLNGYQQDYSDESICVLKKKI